MTQLRGAAAIVGIGLAGIPRMPAGSTPTDCIGLAASAALADAGIAPEEVDGVFASGLQMLMPALGLTEYLRLAPRYVEGTQVGGCAPLVQLNHARAAIATGLCSVALIAYGSTQASSGAAFASLSEPQVFEADLGWPGPVAAYALIAQRHMHDFGTRRQDLAEVAVAARRWAQLTPGATAQAPLTLDDVLASRMVASPLTVRDCCLVTDGGGALVVVSAQRARSMRQPVYVLAGAEHATHRSIAQMSNLTTTGAAVTGPASLPRQGSPRRTSTFCSSTTPSPSTQSCSWKISASVQKGKVALLSATAPSRQADVCPSTPMAVAYRSAIPACTAFSH